MKMDIEPIVVELPVEAPWGMHQVFGSGKRWRVKRIVVEPGARTSLQSHAHRSETWMVVEGTAHVTVGDIEWLAPEGSTVFVPEGDRHRITNPGKVRLVIVELQTGSYLGEDDITRHEDDYGRVTT